MSEKKEISSNFIYGVNYHYHYHYPFLTDQKVGPEELPDLPNMAQLISRTRI